MLQHELIRGSSFLFLGTFFANILAFLFNLFVIRKLSYAMYGEYASLISLFTLISVPSGAFGTIIVRFATNFFSLQETAKAKKLFVQMVKFILCLFVLLFIGFIVFSGLIKGFLHITDTYLILWVGLLVGLAYLNLVNTSFLQSLLRFDFIAILTIIGGLLKLIFGYFFLLLSTNLGNIFFAIAISIGVPYIVSFIPFRFLRSVSHAKVTIPINEIFLYGLPASITVLALSSLTSTDIILVKHFFPSQTAGIYAGLSLIGKVIFYFTGTIPTVMFPLLIKRANEGKQTASLLIISLILVLVPSLAITGFYALFPRLAITVFLGGKGYLSAAGYLGWFGIFITLFSMINLLTSFFLSLKQLFVVYLLSIGAVLQIFLITILHGSLLQVIFDSLASLLVILISLLVYYVQAYASKTKSQPDFINNPSV